MQPSLETRVTALETKFETHMKQQDAMLSRMDHLTAKLETLAVEIRGTVLALKWLVPVCTGIVALAAWFIERVR